MKKPRVPPGSPRGLSRDRMAKVLPHVLGDPNDYDPDVATTPPALASWRPVQSYSYA